MKSLPLSPTSQSISRKEKIKKIKACLSQKEVNLWKLRELCLTEGGLISSELRRKSWHKLVGINRDGKDNSIDHNNSNNNNSSNREEQSKNKNSVNKLEDSLTEDTELISRDVGRAVYFRYPITEANKGRNSPSKEEDNYIESGQSRLTHIIVSTISDNSHNGAGGRLNYYQGFHDVASVIFVNMPREPELACAILQRIAQSHLRDTMMEDFSYVSALLEIVFYPLLQVIDEELHDYLILRELGPTAFLTWMITLFSHDIHDQEIASRMFDAIIASHPLMSLYLMIAALTHPKNRQLLFDANKNEVAMLQVVATGLMSELVDDFVSTHDGLSVQDIIDYALTFMKQVPPESLLNLANNYDLGHSKILMKRCESLCLFKSPQPWALVTNYKQNKDIVGVNAQNEVEISMSLSVSQQFPKAKIASGVSLIMYDDDDVDKNHFIKNASPNDYVKKFGTFLQNTLHVMKSVPTR